MRKHRFAPQRNKQTFTKRLEHQLGRTLPSFGLVGTEAAVARTIIIMANMRTHSGPGIVLSPFTCTVSLNPDNIWKVKANIIPISQQRKSRLCEVK